MLALQRQAPGCQRCRASRIRASLEKIRFRYAVSGSNPPWKPLRAFDDGEKVYIQFPAGIAQGELPPLFVIGAQGDGRLVNYRFPRRTTSWIACSVRPNCGWAATAATWCASSAPMALRGGTEHEPGRRSDLAAPQVDKVAPEAVALRAQPRPVTRLNRRTLAILAGGLSVAVLGALIWSLQPHRRGAGRPPSFTTSIACRSRKGWIASDGLFQAAAGLAARCTEAGATAAGRSWPGHRECRSNR